MSAFGKAFNAARKAGKSTFSFGGKKYNTKLAATTPKKAPVPTPRPDTTKTASNSAGGKALASKAAASRVARQRAAQAAQDGPGAFEKMKAGMSSKSGKAFAGVKPLSIGSRVANSIRIGQTAVDRGHRRDAAGKANQGARSTVQKMLDGMNPKPRKRK